MDYDDVIRFLPLYKAALEDDWESAKRFFQDDEEKLTAKITYWWETPLHIAVGTNRSHRFVKELVERIMAAGGVEKLRTPSWWKNNSLHYAAKVGNTTAVRLLVEKDPDMPQIANPGGNTALKLAAWYAQKETLCYLLEVTKDVVGEDGTSPFRGLAGADLITLIITAGFYGMLV